METKYPRLLRDINVPGLPYHRDPDCIKYLVKTNNVAIKITPENYLELYHLVEEQAARRQIPMPEVFTEPSKELAAGANEVLYRVSFSPKLLNTFNKQELKGVVVHEVRHFFQPDSTGYDEDEFEADQAFIDAVGLEPFLSTCAKVKEEWATGNVQVDAEDIELMERRIEAGKAYYQKITSPKEEYEILTP